jgi:hypothetical protein
VVITVAFHGNPVVRPTSRVYSESFLIRCHVFPVDRLPLRVITAE